MAFHLSPRTACSLALVALLAACGGGGSSPAPEASAPPVVVPPVVIPPVVVPPVVVTHTIGGSLSGMTGGLVLQNNAGDNLSPATNGSFTFATAVAEGATYAVTVRTNPPFQRCVVVNGSGTVGTADVSNVAVTCTSTGVVVSTVAGGSLGSADGTGSAAQFSGPTSGVVDPDGNLLVSDWNNNSLRKITPAGVVSTLSSGLNWPNGVIFNQGRLLLVSQRGNKLLQMNPLDGSTTELPVTPPLNGPIGLVGDAAGNLYVSEANHRIRKIAPDGTSTVFAGSTQGVRDGQGTAAQFYNPAGMAIDPQGNLYVVDRNGPTIRKITPDGNVTTLAGIAWTQGWQDGPGATARFLEPVGIAMGPDGMLYLTEAAGQRIRRIAPDGTVSTVAGNGTRGTDDGAGNAARFDYPMGVAFDAAGDLFVFDWNSNRIRKLSRD